MSDPQPTTTTTLEGLERDLRGSLVRVGDTEWDTARAAWNLAVDQRPVAVAFPADAADIRAIVRFAADTDLQVMAQSTGHLAAAVGDLTDTILIRTTHLQGLVVDESARTVRVGAGVTWGPVSAALAKTGLVALAGSSPDVGVVGYTLGGGYSWFARSHGLAASAVTAVELVLANGDLIRATATNHSDLFWAVRGGGGNFGIVTALEFRVFPVADAYAGMLLFPIDRAHEVLAEYAAWGTHLPTSATTCARLLRFPPLPELPEFLRGQSFVGVDGAITASDAEAKRILAPLRAMVPVIDTFARVSTASLADVHMDPAFPVPGVGNGLAITSLDAPVLDALLESAAGDPASPLLAVDIRQLGGALGTPNPDGGAVNHLSGAYLVYAVGITPVPEAAAAVAAAVASVRQALKPWASAQTCSNFRESPAEPDELWDEATLKRLRAIKHARDPHNVIRAAHPLG